MVKTRRNRRHGTRKHKQRGGVPNFVGTALRAVGLSKPKKLDFGEDVGPYVVSRDGKYGVPLQLWMRDLGINFDADPKTHTASGTHANWEIKRARKKYDAEIPREFDTGAPLPNFRNFEITRGISEAEIEKTYPELHKKIEKEKKNAYGLW